MQNDLESKLREALEYLLKIRNLMSEGLAKTEEKTEALKKAKEGSQFFEDDIFKRRAEKLTHKTVYTEAYTDGFVTASEVQDIEPWIILYREYLQRFKIKHRLESEGFWMQSNIDGEDNHIMIGNKDKPGEKVHAIIDGETGEVRIELNDKNKQPHDLVKRIETILTMKTGEQIRSTRSSLEFFEGKIDPKTDTNVPVLDIEISLGGSGGPDGHFVYFNVVNVGDKVAIDTKWGIRAFGYEWRSPTNGFILKPGENKRVEYRIDGQKPHTEKVEELNLFIEYKNNAGLDFFTRRELSQKMTPGGIMYELEVGKFHPVEKNVDYGIRGIGQPHLNGHKYESEFEVEYNGERKIIDIGVSRTFLSTWELTTPEDIRTVITELGVRKVRKMLIKGIIGNYCFITTDFPQDFQNNYDGYKKLRDSI